MARRIKPLTTMSLTDEIPAPWTITDTGLALKIEDAHGRGVAWVYYRRQEALKADYLTHEQAVKMAGAIARLSRSEAPGR